MPFSPKNLGFLVLLLILTPSCDLETTYDEVSDKVFGLDYFPLEIGKFWEYKVDSIIFDPGISGTNREDISIIVREEITDQLTNDQGEDYFRITRSSKKDENDQWKVEGVFLIGMSDTKAWKTEGNITLIKFVFPPLQDSEWVGHAYIDENLIITVKGETLSMFKNWEKFHISSIGVAESIQGNSYSDVATVIQVDSDNLLEKRYGMEKYARGVGMIFKRLEILDVSCNATPQDPCPSATDKWEEKAEKGFIVEYNLLRHN